LWRACERSQYSPVPTKEPCPAKIHDQLLERAKAHIAVYGVKDIFCLDRLYIIDKSLDVDSL